MPYAKTTRGRLRQVELWLKANYPTEYPVVVKVCRFSGEDLDCVGFIQRDGRKLVIKLDSREVRKLVRGRAVELLLHEYAHALVYKKHMDGHPMEVHHDEHWGVAYAKLYNAYFDEDGDKDSDEYSTRPFA